MQRSFYRLLAGAAAIALSAPAVSSQELTIFWAEWDPANYLQELANEYEAETGVVVTVETTPWSDFQTKAFTEFNAKGSAYDMIVGDSQWVGAASEAGHYVDLTDFFNEHNLGEVMAPATVKYYSEYGGKYWSVPAEGDAVGWSYRKDWFEDPAEMAAFEAKYGYPLAPPADWNQLIDIAEFFHRPDQDRYGVAIYTDNSYDALVMGVENALFSYGADLGDFQTYQVDGILNSEKAVEALEAYRKLYGFTPPGWSKTFFVENNQAITENLAAMSMNYFAFFPALVNPATNPNAAKGIRPVPFIRGFLRYVPGYLPGGMANKKRFLNAWAHNPYPGVTSQPSVALSIAHPDSIGMANIQRLLTELDKSPLTKNVRVWATEFGWETSGPASTTTAKQAQFIAEAYDWLDSKRRIDIGITYGLTDAKELVNDFQSGTYFANGTLKPSMRMFQRMVSVPAAGIVNKVRKGTTVSVWGRSNLQPKKGVLAYRIPGQKCDPKYPVNTWCTVKGQKKAADGSIRGSIRVTTSSIEFSVYDGTVAFTGDTGYGPTRKFSTF